MKQPWEWDESDILNLIDAREKESLVLEYKSCDALQLNDEKKKAEISKDISAFANSAGGTLIYGVIEKDNFPIALDSGFSPKPLSTEWLEHVINSRIQRRILGIRIRAVPLTGERAGRFAYTVSIPQSLQAPHQAYDKRYYKRFNFESTPMEDYEIRDVFRRADSPDLRLSFTVSRIPESTQTDTDSLQSVTFADLGVQIVNDAPTPAMYVIINIYLDIRLLTDKMPDGFIDYGEIDYERDGAPVRCRRFGQNHAVPARMPIFKGTSFSTMEKPLRIRVPSGSSCLLAWQILSPGMTPKSDSILLSATPQPVT